MTAVGEEGGGVLNSLAALFLALALCIHWVKKGLPGQCLQQCAEAMIEVAHEEKQAEYSKMWIATTVFSSYLATWNLYILKKITCYQKTPLKSLNTDVYLPLTRMRNWQKKRATVNNTVDEQALVFPELYYPDNVLFPGFKEHDPASNSDGSNQRVIFEDDLDGGAHYSENDPYLNFVDAVLGDKAPFYQITQNLFVVRGWDLNLNCSSFFRVHGTIFKHYRRERG
ncbi:hypothetical protein BDQ12DRAFT_670210 [Crucibulum laeve]|uniref:Uncharacterized protein n=1 Tax=Crucibulum laeve TaxID=68775 RepID=A0A5C3LK71_9AGAR|nr:hypothetical protein BDQ12DRAFT_670210 [Crucibulum laeve]